MVAHESPSQNTRNSLYDVVKSGRHLFPSIHPVLLAGGRSGKIAMDAMENTESASSKTVGVRIALPENSAHGTHNGFRSYGQFRCLIAYHRRIRSIRPLLDTYRKRVRNVGAVSRMQPVY
jgi:hypothetical protein